MAELELQRLYRKYKEVDSFEGNAQSFRILTVLAVRSRELPGLNLTRATLNAVLKYPYGRDPKDPKKSVKWGAYKSEEGFRRWARQREPDDRKCVEAEVMDWADDIAYAVHDAEDFYSAGLIPLDELRTHPRKRSRTPEGATELEKFVTAVFDRWRREKRTVTYDDRRAMQLLNEIFAVMPIVEPYSGSRDQRAAMGVWTSHLIGTYVRAIRLAPKGVSPGVPRVVIPRQSRFEVDLLKQLTWHYVILNPALAAQQYGQRRIISDLFEIFLEAADARPTAAVRRVLPTAFEEALADSEAKGRVPRGTRIRIAADAVAGLTEQQALDMHRRLTGYDSRSVLDPIVR